MHPKRALVLCLTLLPLTASFAGSQPLDPTGRRGPIAASFDGTLDTLGLGSHRVIGTADVTGDGLADLVSTHPSGHAYVWPGDDAGGFGAAIASFGGTLDASPWDGSGHHIVGLADVTGDGRADLVSSHTNGNAYVWPGRADGSFGAAVASFRGTLDMAHIDGRGHWLQGVADVTGDGHADLISTHDNGHAYVWPGRADGSFGGAAASFHGTLDTADADGAGHVIIDVADVTGDGRADLVSAHTNGTSYVWPGLASGHFGHAVASFAGTLHFTNWREFISFGSYWSYWEVEGHTLLGVADVSGDGRGDLISAHSNGNLYVWPGTASGRFGAAESLLHGQFESGVWDAVGHLPVGLADVDGDERADITTVHEDGHAYVWRVPFGDAGLTSRQAFDELRYTYLLGDHDLYEDLLTHEIRIARRSTPEVCVERMFDLAEISCQRSLDGLETLTLVYQDCAASGHTPFAGSARADAVSAVQLCAQFEEAPHPQVYPHLGVYDGLSTQAMRGEAVRQMFELYAEMPTSQVASAGLEMLMGHELVQRSLCELPGRVDQLGRESLQDVMRAAHCRLNGYPGSPDGIGDICDALSGEGHENSLTGPGIMQGMEPLTEDQIRRLRHLCDGGAGGVAPMNGQAYHDVSQNECLLQSESSTLQPGELAGLMVDCLGASIEGSGTNPLASGGPVRNAVNRMIRDKEEERDDAYAIAHGAGSSHSTTGQGELFGGAIVGQRAQYAVEALRDTLELLDAADSAESAAAQAKEAAKAAAVRLVDCTSSCGQAQADYDAAASAYVDADLAAQTARRAADASLKANRVQVLPQDHMDTNTGTVPMGSSLEPGPNLDNSACQELSNLGFLTGQRDVFSDLYDREPGRDPRVENPHPYEDGYTPEDDDMSCSAGETRHAGACNDLILCAPGTQLDPDTCVCEAAPVDLGQSDACAATTCPVGTEPVPVSAQICMCEPAEHSGSGGPAPLPTDPFEQGGSWGGPEGW